MKTEELYSKIKALILSDKIQFPDIFEIIPAKTISEDCGFDWVIFKHKLDNLHLFTLNEMMTIANTIRIPFRYMLQLVRKARGDEEINIL
ncbi:hypothetical protein GFS24_05140 [Chitinophaga sp. SYP-B3965]|uniref:hypothetical protein n=1 Tax=Chitinophaga sp. SYP-B3965 TaxID=2663120 RepID=UPI001299547F|nr:hypothetical protein [Chitinophaga sp. SYP-B3965]MRG44485.1 hypothetical protein [Chitinophaga sp. SYP-B3965]